MGVGGGGGTHHARPQSLEFRSSHLYEAGTEHVGFSPTWGGGRWGVGGGSEDAGRGGGGGRGGNRA